MNKRKQKEAIWAKEKELDGWRAFMNKNQKKAHTFGYYFDENEKQFIVYLCPEKNLQMPIYRTPDEDVALRKLLGAVDRLLYKKESRRHRDEKMER